MRADWKISGVDDVRRSSSEGLATGPFGSSVSAKFFQKTGIPLIRGSNLSEGVGRRLVEDDYVFVSEEKAFEFPRAIAKSGDLIFTCWGTIGQVGLIDKRASFERYLISNKQMKLSPDPAKADSLFLYYLFSSPKMQATIHSLGIGSSVPGFNLGQLRSIKFPLPPLPEQSRIASVLSALDDKIAQNRRTAKALGRLARAIFRAWFVDFEPVKAKAAGATSFPSMPQPIFGALPTRLVDSEIGLVPEGWEVKPLSSCCAIVGGGTPKRSVSSYWGGNVPWYSIKDAPADGVVWVINTDERITKDGLANSAARIIPKGSSIISARGTVGKLAMASKDMAFNQSCYGLLPNDGVSFCYLYILLQNSVVELLQRTHGSVFDTITRSTFDGVMIITPPGKVVSSFEEIVSPLFDKLLSSLYESEKLAMIRDYLLPRLLDGSVRAEPANG